MTIETISFEEGRVGVRELGGDERSVKQGAKVLIDYLKRYAAERHLLAGVEHELLIGRLDA